MYSNNYQAYPPQHHFFLNSHTEWLNERHKHEEFINSFVDSCVENSQTCKKEQKKRLGIAETKQLVSEIKKLNDDLEYRLKILNNNKNSGEFNFESELKRCKEIKLKIEKSLEILKSNEEICQFKKLVERRKKKRLREKRKKLAWKEEKNLREERRKNINSQIDNWIRKKQAVIEREKQEENLRKDADLILSDVRGKKSDSKKYLIILKELQNLRKVKTANARARGENLSLAADESFERIINQLIEHWSELDREYSIEEQGLKLMLKTDNEMVIEKKKKNNFDDWELAIFGKKLGRNESFGDLHGLVMIRYAWDKFIGDGSRIPVGWVMPQPPSSAAWQKFLKK
uniref:Programmed cell death protein 7 n=1 Tax=Bracon brevicornis TaxID=1563983 RepID=A0A6V7KI52_9HYME